MATAPRSNEEYGRLAAAIYKELCAAKLNVEELTKLGESIFAEVDLDWALQQKKLPPSVLAKLFRVAQRLDPHFLLQATDAPAEVPPKPEADSVAPAPAKVEESPVQTQAVVTSPPVEEANTPPAEAPKTTENVIHTSEASAETPAETSTEAPAPGTNGTHPENIPPEDHASEAVSVGKW